MAWYRCLAVVAPEENPIPLPVLFEPLAGLWRVQAATEATELVLNQGVHRIENEPSNGGIACFIGSLRYP